MTRYSQRQLFGSVSVHVADDCVVLNDLHQPRAEHRCGLAKDQIILGRGRDEVRLGKAASPGVVSAGDHKQAVHAPIRRGSVRLKGKTRDHSRTVKSLEEGHSVLSVMYLENREQVVDRRAGASDRWLG